MIVQACARLGAALGFLALAAGPMSGETLPFPPGAVLAAERVEPYTTYAVPTGPWDGDTVPALVAEGRVALEAWHIPGGAGTLELLAPLRSALAEAGYAVVYDCAATACGAFDFRYALDVLPEPEMHVDLADFRFLSARRPGAGPDDAPAYVTLLVSRSDGTGYVQVARIDPSDPPPAAPVPAEPGASGASTDAGAPQQGPPEVGDPQGIAAALDRDGRAVLPGLNFETGSARLAEGDYPALAELAEYLRAHPERRVTLVGHTDAQGSLAANVALSRARARSVVERLVAAYGVTPGRLSADGVGYLLPLASNLTEAGRTRNRRVEAVVTVAE